MRAGQGMVEMAFLISPTLRIPMPVTGSAPGAVVEEEYPCWQPSLLLERGLAVPILVYVLGMNWELCWG